MHAEYLNTKYARRLKLNHQANKTTHDDDNTSKHNTKYKQNVARNKTFTKYKDLATPVVMMKRQEQDLSQEECCSRYLTIDK